MSEPFFAPLEATSAEALAAIAEDLEVFDDEEERLFFLMDLGRKLPPFPSDWMNDAHRVQGCLSSVWMERSLRDGRLFFAGASNAAIVSGIVYVMLRVYSGRTPAEILDTDPIFLTNLGLIRALSVNRGSGAESMVRAIRQAATALAG